MNLARNRTFGPELGKAVLDLGLYSLHISSDGYLAALKSECEPLLCGNPIDGARGEAVRLDAWLTSESKSRLIAAANLVSGVNRDPDVLDLPVQGEVTHLLGSFRLMVGSTMRLMCITLMAEDEGRGKAVLVAADDKYRIRLSGWCRLSQWVDSEGRLEVMLRRAFLEPSLMAVIAASGGFAVRESLLGSGDNFGIGPSLTRLMPPLRG